jgi:hypothetical protein
MPKERVIDHLSRTLSATRAELKALALLADDGQFYIGGQAPASGLVGPGRWHP